MRHVCRLPFCGPGMQLCVHCATWYPSLPPLRDDRKAGDRGSLLLKLSTSPNMSAGGVVLLLLIVLSGYAIIRTSVPPW